MAESVQKWLERNRPPRVKITYDVETGGAIEKMELPFIVGVLADLSGDRGGDFRPAYSDRQMLPIDRDNFNDVMKSLSPRVSLGKVKRFPNDLSPPSLGGSTSETMSDSIVFNSLSAFDPVALVQQIPELSKLYRVRSNIRSLQSKAEAADSLNVLLNAQVVKSPTAKESPQENRVKLRVLAGPTYRNSLLQADKDIATGALSAAKASLYGLAMTLAKLDIKAQDAIAAQAAVPAKPAESAKPAAGSKPAVEAKAAVEAQAAVVANGADQAKLEAANNWGFDTISTKDADGKNPVTDADKTLTPVRKFVGLFGESATSENLSKANDQLQVLTKWDDTVDPAIQKNRDHIVKSLGLKAATDADKASLKADATALLNALTPVDDVIDADALRAAMLVLGLQKTDDSDSIQLSEDSAEARKFAENKSEAANRWFANNLLLQLNDEADAVKKSLVRENIEAVLELMDAAGVTTDEDRRKLTGPLGYYTTDVLSRLDSVTSKFTPRSAMAAIDQHVTDIDAWLSLQLSEIMHAPGFQKLEASWRGLYYFVSNTETNKMLKIGVFNATLSELLQDMDTAVDKDQSKLFKMIYEDQFGTFGGKPYSLLVGDYEIDRSAEKFEFLEKISEVAASAHAPFITSASSAMFGLPSFRDLAKPRDLQKIFEDNDLIRWNAFRDSEDSRYVTLVLPHVLLRLPYGKDSAPVNGLNFEEKKGESSSAPTSENFLWGNAAYMLATRITSAFSHYNWTAAIRGVEGGGLVENLPLYSFKTTSGSDELFCPTEVSITDRREKELNDLGFISLCHYKGKGQAAFFGGRTSNQPKRYFSDSANANAKISALLPYMLAASRFAHYIKVIMRNKIGSFLTRGNVEAYLNGWIANYVLLDENASQDAKASYPLSQAKVVVSDIPGSPGAYNAVVFLRPHFQLEELTTSIRLVATLPG